MRNCSCKLDSLRTFVQSLTGLGISQLPVTTTHRILSRIPTASFPSEPAFSRPYSATAAARFPRQGLRGSYSRNRSDTPLPEATSHESSHNATADLFGAAPLDASTSNLDQAKRQGAILDFSPESIDSLVSYIDTSSTGGSSPDEDVESPRYRKPKSDSAAASLGASKLKRLKIIKEDKYRERGPRREEREPWQIQKEALKKKFPEGWHSRKRLSPDALDGIRALHEQFPEQYPTWVLASKFEVSPEVIRRILKSKWRPNPEEETNRQTRWFNRGKDVWSQMAALGTKPPKRWRREGIVRDPIWNEPRGPRTQPPKRRRDRESPESPESQESQEFGNSWS